MGKSLNTKAQSITRSIIADHSSGSRVLSTKNYDTVKKVITERVNWHRSMEQWEFVCEWCDALDMLICNSDLQCKIALSLIKAGSLIHLNDFESALAASETAISISKSSRTVEMHFKALLHARKPVDIAVQRFIQLVGEEKSNNPLIEYTDGCLEKLSRIMACVTVARSSQKLSDLERNRATRLLYKEWMKMYASSQMWKSMPQNDETDFRFGEETNGNQDRRPTPTVTYLRAAIDLGNLYLKDFMQRKLLRARPAERSRFDCRTSSAAQSNFAAEAMVTVEGSAPSPTPPSDSLQRKSAVTTEKVTCTTMVVYPTANHTLAFMNQCVEEVDTTKVEVAEPTGDQLGDSSHSRPDYIIVLDGAAAPALAATHSIEYETSEAVKQPEVRLQVLEQEPASLPMTSTNRSDADYFFFGVQDLDQQYDENSFLYSFSCSLLDIQCEILSLLEEVAANIESILRATGLTSHLGDTEDISWLALLAFNLGKLLLEPRLCIFETANSSDPPTATATAPPSVPDTYQRFELSAKLFEIAEKLYSSIPLLVESGCESKRCHCLLVAAAARLDMENIPAATINTTKRPREPGAQYETPPRTKRRGDSGTATIASTSLPTAVSVSGVGDSNSNLTYALMDIHKAVEILKQHSDFEDSSTRTIRKQLVLIEFACLCKSMDIKSCQQFVREKEAHFLSMMTAQELMACVSVAHFEAGGSLEICRAMLMYALQVCARTNHGEQRNSNNLLMSQIFCRLIETSPSRQSALDKVTEFEQWAMSLLAAENHEGGRGDEPEDSTQTIGEKRRVTQACSYTIRSYHFTK